MRCIFIYSHCIRIQTNAKRENYIILYTGVGLSALLVSTYRAMRRPLDRGTSDRDWLHAFFVLNIHLCLKGNMAQNVFMAQICFLIPLRKLDKTYRKRFVDGYGQLIKPPFCANKDEMLCQYINMDKHDFFFKSFPHDSLNCVFHKVTVEAFVVSFRLSKNKEQTDYFLAVSVKVDKCFSETYTQNGAQGFIPRPSVELCTKRDLIYLQKAIYETFDCKELCGLFYPLQNPLQEHSHKEWAKQLVAQAEGLAMRDVDFEYSAIKMVSADINTQGSTGNFMDWLTQQMTDLYYKQNHPSFDSCWNGDDATFAYCLISANDNINNISSSHIQQFNNFYSTNKHEKTFATEKGIVFMQTHYPFDLTAEENAKLSANKLSIPWKNGPEGVENICELCSALHFLKQIKRIRFRLKEQCVIGIRRVLAKIAYQLGIEHVHLADIDKKFQFIFQRMGITLKFQQIQEEAILLADSSNLLLNIKSNRKMLVLTILAFILAVLQTVQNYLYNSKSQCMEDALTVKVILETPRPKILVGFCEDPVMFVLQVLIALIILIVLYHCVFLPAIRKMHKQFHRDMEDEE